MASALRTVALPYLAMALAAAACGEGGSPARPARVKVCVVAIIATDKDDTIAAELRCIAREVRKRDSHLTGFKVHSLMCKSLAVNEKGTFPVLQGKTVEVVIRQAADEHNKVELAVTPPGHGEIVYRTTCGKYLPIVTRCQDQRKQRLILAICVKPCNGK